ncbi:hypothetical protein PsYK624_038020 [Phanerochaete sordida]|uniref:Transcription factor tau subunit sfc3/Tfc3 C-terminal domain-containing protein n=1 Tax=Phanerochaete sordida TaxID=48140 RepID=A0A9P3G4J2_9APHY|nr:hypothetical protein PsYK624_038020 [Phanerochaete sordida]
MDELLHHCIRELAFEGDFGCDASRLRDFVTDFYKSKSSPQNVDDAYCAFVWSVVAQQPEVRVGTVPEGAPEVYIATQPSKKGKAKYRADEEAAPQERSLQLVPDAAQKTLDELVAEYGDALRIAIEPDRLFVALTGSHIRPSKLTPMVYSGLQLVARGRENGLSVVELSKKTGYDAKTSHYLVDKMLELNFIVKLKKPGVGSNLCIHKHFFEKSEIWQNIFTEGQPTKEADEENDEDDDEDDDVSEQGAIRFDPIGVKHLSRLDLIRGRMEKLLKNSPHNLHKMHNLIIAIGFPNPTKSERRFFQTRLRELENEGFLEIVQVRGTKRLTKCVRLVHREDVEDEPATGQEVIEAEGLNEKSLKATVTFQRQILDVVDSTGTKGATLNDVVDALCDFDKRVMDFQLNRLKDLHPPPHVRDLGLSQAAESFGRERRYKYFTFRHFMKVADKEKLDVTLAEDYLDQAGEFRALDEGMFYQDTQELHAFVDTFRVTEDKPKKKLGRPRKHPLPEDTEDGPSARPKKRKRGEPEDPSAPPRKRGRPRKHPLPEDAAAGDSASAPTAPKKRGRPPKASLPESASAPAPKKRGRPPKQPPTEGGSASAPAPKRRGRPPKNRAPEEVPATSAAGGSVSDKEGEDDQGAEATEAMPPPDTAALAAVEQERASQIEPQIITADVPTAPSSHAPAPEAPKKRGRGRPRKHPLPENASTSVVSTATGPSEAPASMAAAADEGEASATPAPKRRGRPPKARPTAETRAPASPAKRGRPRKSAPRENVPMPAEDTEMGEADGAEQASEPGQTVPDASAGQADAPTAGTGQKEAPAAPAPEGALMDVDATAHSLATPADTRVAMHALPEDFPVSHMRSSATPADESVIDPALLEMDHSVSTRPRVVTADSGAFATPAPSASLKRTLSDTAGPSSTKRSRHTGPLANISRGRRHKEVLQTIENLGGIANTSAKEFYAAHAAVVESLANAGELTSLAVGSRFDKKTMTTVLSELENLGKIKMLTTSAAHNVGGFRQIKVAYLADTPEEKLNEFLTALSRSQQPTPYQSAIRVLDEPVEFGGSKANKVVMPAAPVILLTDMDGRTHDDERARQLLEADEETVRASLLTENNTIIQEYGFIVGKIARARELYLHLARVIEERKSSNVISTEPRILHLSYLSEEIPVSVYTSVVTIRVHNEELLQILSTPEGRQTPVKDLPESVKEACEFDKWRTRQRVMDVLNVLQSLKLMTALNPTDAEEPLVRIAPNGDHPTAFEAAPDEAITATLSAPQYWKFNDSASLHLWVLDENDPPFWRRASTKSVAEAEQFWRDLNRACLDEPFCTRTLDEMTVAGPLPEESAKDVPQKLRKIIRRSGQWSTMYNFSWYQRRFLSHHIDIVTAATPLQDEDGGSARLARIARVVSAPQDQVARFYERERHSLLHSIEKVRRRTQDAAQRTGEQKAVLAQKAAEARAAREAAWDAMLARVHPEPLKGTFAARVKPVHARFVQSAGQDFDKWEQEITKTIQEAKVSAKKPAATRRPLASVPARPLPAPLPLAVATNDKPVEDIISSQGPALSQPEAKPKGKKDKGKGKEKEKEKEKEKDETDMFGRRRQRFQWTKDLDELARDASAIIRARCRDGKRLDWAALAQAFPAIPRNSVRQRIGHLREQPGAEAYFRRLEDRWHELWTRHAGTPELPDEDPGSASNFDLVAHVKFLRAHIDKNALRVGFVETEKPLTVVLPASFEAMAAKWEVVEKPLTAPTWDFVWSGVAEEGREKQLSQQCFVLGGNELPPSEDYPTEDMFVADAALKMTLGTPNDAYDAQKASHLLSGVGDKVVGAVVEDLLDRNVLSKLVRDPTRHKPGRTLKISDVNQGALSGQLAPDLFQDAAALEDELLQEGSETAWRDWPLVATDGDITALIELASENKIDFKIDTTHAQSVRPTIDWNSKKASDDDIETAIGIRPKAPLVSAQAPPAEGDVSMRDIDPSLLPATSQEGGHGTTADGERAHCALQAPGLANCAACLASTAQALLNASDPQDAEGFRTLWDALDMAGPEGLTKTELQGLLGRDSVRLLPDYISRLTGAAVPLAFWTGYREVVLVSSQYLGAWSVVTDVDDAKCVRLLPRRWLDISGQVIAEVWAAARKAVMAIVIFHPGISQAEVRWRLRSVYDRQEVHDVLQQLMDEGYLRRDVRTSSVLADEGVPSNVEERLVFWSVSGHKVWYQV